MEGLAHRSELARAGGIRNDPVGRSSPGAEASCCRLPSAAVCWARRIDAQRDEEEAAACRRWGSQGAGGGVPGGVGGGGGGREREREEEEEAKESLLPSSYLFFSFLFATQLTEPIPTPKPAKGKGQTPS